MSVKVNVKLRGFENARVDWTKEMVHVSDIITQEMRANVKAGLDVHGNALTPNKPSYAKRKIAKLGHARPLIAENRSLVTPSSYQIVKVGINHVRITLPGSHPRSDLKVGQIGYIHQFGMGNNPIRHFVGVPERSKIRAVAFLRDTIARLFK